MSAKDVRLSEPLPSAPCRDCGPGYRIGDEGCRHDPYEPASGETGICRTCGQLIWWEEGEVGHRKVIGWSDRIERGGDSVVCFKAVGYRHVPMGAREEAIYRAGVKAALLAAADRVEGAITEHRQRGHRTIVAAMAPLPDLIRDCSEGEFCA